MAKGAIHSCLYKAQVMHHRLAPKAHRFHYNIFMFYLDLDEINLLNNRLKLMSHNRFNLFNYRDKDHLQLPRETPDTTKTTRQHINNYLSGQGIVTTPKRIMVLTNLCTAGYQFNPVSFYYCYDDNDMPFCAIVEVCNTFREMKPYFLGPLTQQQNSFKLNTKKYFYVSPFIDMDTCFDFDLHVPGERLQIKIDDFDTSGNRFFISTLTGSRKPLSDTNLLLYFISFPLITLKVIGLIHWQAIKLWLKKLSYHKKDHDMELQKEVFRPYKPNYTTAKNL